jgi:hypothetical protein
MQAPTRLKSPETRRIGPAFAKTMPETTPPGSAADWKPQPCGLSREELRRIVRKILG